MWKLNFTCGEPFLYASFTGELARYCKVELGLEAVSIVTNGSLVKEAWAKKYGKYIDVLAVSCDSFDEETNKLIRRGDGKHVEALKSIRAWRKEEGILLKVNTVVNRYNVHEDMREDIKKIAPMRRKILQELIVPGVNDSEDAKMDLERLVDEEFKAFCERHREVKVMVSEGNDLLTRSYLILDDYMRSLDLARGQPGSGILEVGVEDSMSIVRWDDDGFVKKGDLYDWTKKGKVERGDASLGW